jgi:chromate transporter
LKEDNEIKSKPKFSDTIKFWIQLGFISFGGPAGQIALMHETIVEKKNWLTEKKFLNALNFCILLPGPEAQQLATYIGWLLHGGKGGLSGWNSIYTSSFYFFMDLIFNLC